MAEVSKKEISEDKLCCMCPKGACNPEYGPKKLKCGHYMCVPCVAALFRASDTVRCTVCREILWSIKPYDNSQVPKNCLRVWKVSGSKNLLNDPLLRGGPGDNVVRSEPRSQAREATVRHILTCLEFD